MIVKQNAVHYIECVSNLQVQNNTRVSNLLMMDTVWTSLFVINMFVLL